ncbi:SDR family NAD(P)-dependent oxidoreductase [Mycobacteroides salmoniphilum]|uniref:SDR family NAD(P)-dependent oxidoreductase n=1 Tax=Mycobacteroides salmoniphilum TaxID=404941 RepID=UPI0009934E60|nr:SDR family NAD(P)-dependent oxidoreductase [Mycobacteroides salmoniphilum]QCH24040.1 putative oxidoreductase [Mycobacteroides salmoniphilum]
MNRTMLVLGAGTGTGAAVARRFGRDGFHVAVVGRRREPLDSLVADLLDDDVLATAFPTDLTDAVRVAELLSAVTSALPPIEAIYYGPSSPVAFTAARELTVAEADRYWGLLVRPLIHTVSAVLPGMIERGRGTILSTIGGTGARAMPEMSGPGPAAAAARNYLQGLHSEVAPHGVYVGLLTIGALILGSEMAAVTPRDAHEFPTVESVALAEQLWDMSAVRNTFENFVPSDSIFGP